MGSENEIRALFFPPKEGRRQVNAVESTQGEIHPQLGPVHNSSCQGKQAKMIQEPVKGGESLGDLLGG